MKKLHIILAVLFLFSVAPEEKAEARYYGGVPFARVGVYNNYVWPYYYPTYVGPVGWGGAFFVGPMVPYGYYGFYGTFGAIAYSPLTGQAGWSRRYRYEGDAEREALYHCRAADCQTMVWFRSSCGAVASSSTDSTVYGWGWHNMAAIAQQRALAECNSRGIGCRIAASACSP